MVHKVSLAELFKVVFLLFQIDCLVTLQCENVFLLFDENLLMIILNNVSAGKHQVKSKLYLKVTINKTVIQY